MVDRFHLLSHRRLGLVLVVDGDGRQLARHHLVAVVANGGGWRGDADVRAGPRFDRSRVGEGVYTELGIVTNASPQLLEHVFPPVMC